MVGVQVFTLIGPSLQQTDTFYTSSVESSIYGAQYRSIIVGMVRSGFNHVDFTESSNHFLASVCPDTEPSLHS